MTKSAFADKTVLVTGASRGIGAATARHFAELGANVVATARSTSQLETLVGEITQAGGKAIASACDVADYAAVEATIAQALERFGAIDILVNNAGLIDPIARIDQSDPAGWGQVIDVNVKGPYHALHAILPAMLERGAGVVINISSGAATSALEGWSHYCASKAALLSLTRCAHKELADKGIRVVGLSPGTVATDMQVQIKASGINPVSQLDPAVHIPPLWVDRAIAWLATDAAREYDGDDVSLRSEEIRQKVGLVG